MHARPGALLVAPWLETSGPSRLGPPAKLDPSAADAEVGAAVAAALSQSASAEPAGDPLEPVLRAAGVRSWSAFAKGLRSVDVSREGDRVTVTPVRNRGPREALSRVPERAVQLDSPSAHELGAAVRRVLAAVEVPDAHEPPGPIPAGAAADPIIEFGRKRAWLAGRSDRPPDVARALGLQGVREVSWREGIDAVDAGDGESAGAGGGVFVTPSVNGWTFAVLEGRVADGEGVDLARLSRTFGEAQRFASHRVSDYYEWQRWVNGDPVRRYAWIGGNIRFDDGEQCGAESGIVRMSDLEREHEEARLPDEDTVLDVAAEWSIDPANIEAPETRGTPLVGHLPLEAAVGEQARTP